MWCLTCTLHCASCKHKLQCVKQECTGIPRQVFNPSSVSCHPVLFALCWGGGFARCFLKCGDQQGSGGVLERNTRLRCGLQEILVGWAALELDLPEVNWQCWSKGCAEWPVLQLQGNSKAIGFWSPFAYIYVCVMNKHSHSSLLCRKSGVYGPTIRCKGLTDSFLTWEVEWGGQGAEMECKGGRESPAGLCFLILLSLRRMASASHWHNQSSRKQLPSPPSSTEQQTWTSHAAAGAGALAVAAQVHTGNVLLASKYCKCFIFLCVLVNNNNLKKHISLWALQSSCTLKDVAGEVERKEKNKPKPSWKQSTLSQWKAFQNCTSVFWSCDQFYHLISESKKLSYS